MSRLMGRLRKLERAVSRQAQNRPQPQSLSNEELLRRLREFGERIAALKRLGLPLDPEDSERCQQLHDLAERVRRLKQTDPIPERVEGPSR
jgi:hypothetical protein